jgi:superoxide dismutase, Cu-Zn family
MSISTQKDPKGEIHMKKVMFLLATLAVIISLTTMNAQAASPALATAVLMDAEGQVIGSAKFVEDSTGTVHVNVHVEGLEPGLHGIHIHAIGTCTPPDFISAGSHYNPFGKEHGLENPDGPHAGDLPNLMVNEAGVGHLNTTTDLVTLSSGPTTLFDADGSALVIHANPDDQVTDPTGNSGARIACGVIEAD